MIKNTAPHSKKWLASFFIILILSLGYFQGQAFWSLGELPKKFDLRELKRVSTVREQAWGTCWIFATYLSLESDLLRTGVWRASGEIGPVALAHYHLDKYSGFTRKGDDSHVNDTWYSGQGSRFPGSNTDDPNSGLIVHLGGDFLAATAFLTNTKGAVQERLTPSILRQGDHQLFGDLPTEGVLLENNYRYYFPRKVEWLSLTGTDLEKRERIKKAIMTYGAVASSQVMKHTPLGKAQDGLEIHGSLSEGEKLNHAINLIGWDDSIEFGSHTGAWLAQDSDHRIEETGKALGVFYVLYDDLFAAKDPWMGGVLFRDVIEAPFDNVYTHALHGFRYQTLGDSRVKKIAVKYELTSMQELVGLGFYSLSPNNRFKLTLKTDLKSETEILKIEGETKLPGFTFQELPALTHQGDLFIVLELQDQSYAYDASFTMDVLLGGLPEWGTALEVRSKASPDEGFYFDANSEWHDFSSYLHPSNKQYQVPHAVNNATASPSLNLYTSNLP